MRRASNTKLRRPLDLSGGTGGQFRDLGLAGERGRRCHMWGGWRRAEEAGGPCMGPTQCPPRVLSVAAGEGAVWKTPGPTAGIRERRLP